MNVQVQVTSCAKTSNASTLIDLVISPSETAASLKDKVAEAQGIPFPERELSFDGKVLENLARLADFGIADGCSLHLAIKATEATLAQQCSELLQARSVSADELGLLYSYRYGATISQALGCLGFEGTLEEFIGKQKSLCINNGSVGIRSEDSSLELVASADAPPELLATDRPRKRGSDGYSQATSVLESSPQSLDAQQYVELHQTIYSRSFKTKVIANLNDLVATISEMCCLDIDHVVTGGCVGKGTSIFEDAHAEIVLFVRGLPVADHESWLSSLLKAVFAMMVGQDEALGVSDVHLTEESITMPMKSSGNVTASLFIAPVFESYIETVQFLWQQEQDTLKFYNSAFAKERTQFISRQPSAVKTTIRLMKWWRDQQLWSSQMTRPSDELLELVVVYSAVQTKPSDQKMAIAKVMSLLARFRKLRVVWSNFYTKDDIPGHLLRQKPLLMDPTNPFVNVADPKTFDASELRQLAETTLFFK